MKRLIPLIMFWLGMLLPMASSQHANGFRDEDLKSLPDDLEALYLRGSAGYGIDTVSDAGIAHLVRLKKLKTLHAGGLELTDACLESISQLKSLEELALDNNKLTGSSIKLLLKLSNLRRLNLSGNPMDNRTALETLCQLKGLIELELHNYQTIDDSICKLCSELVNLEKLVLSENTNQVTDEGLAQLCKLSELKALTIRGGKVSGVGLRSLKQLANLERLHLALLSGVSRGSLDFVETLPKLRFLHLESVPLNQDDLHSINRCRQLEELLIWDALSKFPEVEKIDQLDGLSSLRSIRTNERITRKAIRELAKTNRLESISDALTDVADEDIELLAQLPGLNTLYIDSQEVTEASLSSFAKMKSLKTLLLTDKVKVQAEQFRKLGQESLPECTIGLMYSPYTVFHQGRPASR